MPNSTSSGFSEKNTRYSGNKPRLLDLFSCAGGAALGYARAGFEVVGVDIQPQPRYPFAHITADVFTLDYEFLLSFDVIHASPPCQHYSKGSVLARRAGKEYPDEVDRTRRLLVALGKPYIIENVPQAPLRPDVCLDGTMFNLGVIRRRIFETNIPMPTYPRPSSIEGTVLAGDYVTVAGNGGHGNKKKSAWSAAMGIDWMLRNELKQAIPPAFSQWIGEHAQQFLETGIPLKPPYYPNIQPD